MLISKITIIIPTRNESDLIIKTLELIKRTVKTPHEIIVVDDSNDETTNIIKKYASCYDRVRLIKGNSKKKSFARALKNGFENSKGNFAVVVMADLCDEPKTIDKMYKLMGEGYDIVCGSRYMRGGRKIGGPKIQNFFSALVCRMVHLFSGVPTWDISNAFKMYRLKTLKNVNFNLSSGVEASMELTLQAFFNGAKITEIPTTWTGRVLGETKFRIFHRTPKYARIILWSFNNSVRKFLGLKLKKFYVS